MGHSDVDIANNKRDCNYGTTAAPHYTVTHGINTESFCDHCRQRVINKIGMSEDWGYFSNFVNDVDCPNTVCRQRLSEDMFRCIWFSNCRFVISAVSTEEGEEEERIQDEGIATQLTKYSCRGNYGENIKTWLIRLKAFRR